MNKITINTYEKGKVTKTFTANPQAIPSGVVEDLLEIIDLDMIKSLNFEEIKGDDMTALASLIFKAAKQLKPIITECFEMEDEEYKKTRQVEVITAVIEIVKAIFGDLNSIVKINQGKN